jgi:predicted O-methyltransferase YrrM
MRRLVFGVAACVASACDAEPAPSSAAPSPTAADVEAPTPAPAKAEPTPAKAPGDDGVVPHFRVSEKVHTTVDGRGDGPYRFTAPWHLAQMKTWEDVLAPLRGKPGLRYLEIGVFEGRSLLWMFERVLTDASTTATAIDVFAGDYAATFDANIAAAKLGKRVTKKIGPSAQVLRAMGDERFDVIYIDGSHTADDVLADAVLTWPMVEVGGLVIFDDYEWTGRGKGEGVLPVELRPHLAIDAFITAYRQEIEVVHRGYQVIVRKRANPCAVKDYCSPLGDYQYHWRDHQLRKGEQVIALDAAELALVERLIAAKKIGDTSYALSPEQRAAVDLQALQSKLALEL